MVVKKAALEPVHDVEFEFDNVIVEAFTCADCWHLSQALHRRGLPRVIIGAVGAFIEQPKHTDQAYRWFGTHGLNLLPDGRFVDVTGIYPGPRALTRKWSLGVANRLAAAREDTEVHEVQRGIIFLDLTPGFDTSRHASNAYLTLTGFKVVTNGFMTTEARLRPSVDVEWTADAVMHRLMLEGIELPSRQVEQQRSATPDATRFGSPR